MPEKDKIVHVTKQGNVITQKEMDTAKKSGSVWNSVEEYGAWIDKSRLPVDESKYQNTNSTRMYVEDPKPKDGKTRLYETKGGVEKDISREEFDAGRAKTNRSYDGEPINDMKPLYGVKKPK